MIKYTLTLEGDDDILRPHEIGPAITETLALISGVQGTPSRKVTLVIECGFGVDAREVREQLREALKHRPAGVTAKLKAQEEELVLWEKREAPTTPMDRVPGFTEEGRRDAAMAYLEALERRREGRP